MTDREFAWFEQKQKDRGIDLATARARLEAFRIETPSWGYADQGTKFRTFHCQGAARNAFEKLADAAAVHRYTGACPSVAIHIPWDKVDNYEQMIGFASEKGIAIGAVNPNLFQEHEYMLGSVTNYNATVRRQAVDHLLECVDIARTVGSKSLSLWFADGTNYPGQAPLRQRVNWMHECLAEMYGAMDSDMRMLIEYKFYEPAFYHTDLADWGMAFNMANKLGPQAEVLVDTGHHAQGTNIEHIVAYLLNERKLGGFHFNSRKYGDDDLIVGSTNPYELFLIFYQILDAAQDCDPAIVRAAESIAYMIDQSHNIEEKIPAMIRSVLNVQTQYAKALLINFDEVREAQEKQDALGAENAVRSAYEQDVTPFLEAYREERGLPADPMKAFLASGELAKLRSERG